MRLENSRSAGNVAYACKGTTARVMVASRYIPRQRCLMPLLHIYSEMLWQHCIIHDSLVAKNNPIVCGVIPHDRQSPGVGIQATARYMSMVTQQYVTMCDYISFLLGLTQCNKYRDNCMSTGVWVS
jgi:hypothetical protein